MLFCTNSVAELRKKVAVEHEQVKQKEQTPKASYGYGGKFGVEKDRMDKVYHHVFSKRWAMGLSSDFLSVSGRFPI